MPDTQGGQFILVTTPLSDDVLLLRSFTGHEGISQPFRFRLELVSEKHPINLESIIGQNLTANMTLSDGSTRYFNGFVSQFTQTGQDSQFTYYDAEVLPWLWFLSQTADCRIFQSKVDSQMRRIINRLEEERRHFNHWQGDFSQSIG